MIGTISERICWEKKTITKPCTYSLENPMIPVEVIHHYFLKLNNKEKQYFNWHKSEVLLNLNFPHYNYNSCLKMYCDLSVENA